MVLFLDLSSPEPGGGLPNPAPPPPSSSSLPPTPLSTILIYYPIISTLAHSLDLNSLHALSLTSRCVRAAILPYRAQLVHQTLRCVYDVSARSSGRKVTEAEDEGKHEEDGAGDGDGERNEDLYAGNIVAMRRERRRITSPCARDLVAECRRCAKVVCRNCTYKPSSGLRLPSRLRRLCSSCISAPLAALPPLSNPSPPIFCTCATAIYFCQKCAVLQTGEDNEYDYLSEIQLRFYDIKSETPNGTGMEIPGFEEDNRRADWREEIRRCWRGKKCVAAEEVAVKVTMKHTIEVHFPPYNEREENASYLQRADAGCCRKTKKDRLLDRLSKMQVGGLVAEVVAMEARVPPPRVKWKEVLEDGRCVWRWGIQSGDDEDVSAEKRRKLRDAAAAQLQEKGRSWCGWCERVVLGE